MSPFLLAIKKKTASLSLSLSLSTPSRRSLPHSYFSLFAQHSRRLPIKLNSVGKRIDESSSWNGFKIKRYTCFTVFRSSSPLPSILVLLCPTFFICNAMIVTVKQEPFYTKWLELVLLFPRGRERATVSFPHRFVSIFSFLAFSLSLSLSLSLSVLLCRRTKKKKRKTRWNGKESLLLGLRDGQREFIRTRASGNTIRSCYITVFLSYKSFNQDFLYIFLLHSYSSGGLEISKAMGRDPFISRTHSPFTRDH